MLTNMRTKFGPIFIGLIIGFIAFVFIFSGVFNPKATRGLHEGAVAGTVNGEPISLQEFSRELNRRMEFFKSMGGGKISDAQLRAFRIPEMVFNELANRKLMEQAAAKSGLIASDEEVRQKIQEMPVFQREGKFDSAAYRQVLNANNYTPATFEKMVRDDLSLQQWGQYFRNRVRVSNEEVRREFLAAKDKRNIKYVLLPTENVRKTIKDSAVAAKPEEVLKKTDQIADQVAAVLSAEKSSDAKVNALLKPYGVEVKTSGFVSKLSPGLPGVGEARELMNDAFAKKSPVDPKQGGKAKKYSSAAWRLVAVVTESEAPNLAQFESERESLMTQILSRKERAFYEAWMQKLQAKAKIEKNNSVVTSEESENS